VSGPIVFSKRQISRRNFACITCSKVSMPIVFCSDAVQAILRATLCARHEVSGLIGSLSHVFSSFRPQTILENGILSFKRKTISSFQRRSCCNNRKPLLYYRRVGYILYECKMTSFCGERKRSSHALSSNRKQECAVNLTE
jgi:hypothetical protein